MLNLAVEQSMRIARALLRSLGKEQRGRGRTADEGREKGCLLPLRGRRRTTAGESSRLMRRTVGDDGFPPPRMVVAARRSRTNRNALGAGPWRLRGGGGSMGGDRGGRGEVEVVVVVVVQGTRRRWATGLSTVVTSCWRGLAAVSGVEAP